MPQSKCPRQSVEQSLTDARNAGDRRREALALADLGLMHLYEGDAPHAAALLEDALALARQFDDRAWEADVLGNLGMATAAAGQLQRGLALLDEQLRSARAAGDRLAEKTALAHLALTHSRLRDPARAMPLFAQALARAREVGDWQHEAELLWYLAIQHAALGLRDQAVAHAEAAVALFETKGKPQTAWFTRHLQAYRANESGAVPEPAVSGPRLLDMALSSTAAMVKFLGSGLKTTPPKTREQRLQTCASCEYHTGLRCRLCGCFTGAKAAMAHEECPAGKWPV